MQRLPAAPFDRATVFDMTVSVRTTRTRDQRAHIVSGGFRGSRFSRARCKNVLLLVLSVHVTEQTQIPGDDQPTPITSVHIGHIVANVHVTARRLCARRSCQADTAVFVTVDNAMPTLGGPR